MRSVRTLLTNVVVAFQFLTVVPLPLRRPATPRDLGNSVTFFPLVGLAIGLLLFALRQLLEPVFPPSVAAAVLLAAWIACSGALHFDGLLDAADGLLGGHTPKDRLRILRDTRVGSFAVAAGCALLLLKFAALQAVGTATALIVAPILGRWWTSVAVALFPYARAEGTGRQLNENAGWPQAFGATAFAFAPLGLLAPTLGIAAVGASVIAASFSAWLLIRFSLARIPGLTGDIYGALCEASETAAILALAANWPV